MARSFACTAFSSVANAVAEKLIIENAKIPQISETQQQEQVNSEKEDVIQENVLNIPIVKEDPVCICVELENSVCGFLNFEI